MEWKDINKTITLTVKVCRYATHTANNLNQPYNLKEV